MRLLPYEIFASVAATGNLSKTAEEFNITQPAVTHHIKSIEEYLGVALIKRTKYGVALTAEGREYLPYIDEILATNIRADNKIKNMISGTVGYLKVAALTSESKYVNECIVKLLTDYPGINAEVHILSGLEMLDALKANAYDFYFASDLQLPNHEECDHIVLGDEHLAIYVNTSSADAIDLSDWGTVCSQSFISISEADDVLYSKVLNICKNRGFTPRIVNMFKKSESVIFSVNAGLGIAILPENISELYHQPNVKLLPIEGEDALVKNVLFWNSDKLNAAGEILIRVAEQLYPVC